ncbi:MAG: undecaprenyl/decaprenyl-phosphate alpha-N-acetylglucosaminyl 1-phosphate transferase [Candidatus Andersenbacteria bacterium]|nr:undecaprenyl/decaprenyl-phosphate alpha-N-acetylglucosaminyl 1-phosphate transferase [Candidatus Andersenbacteria bacterium]
MVFDFTPLTAWHFSLFLITFLASFVWIHTLKSKGKKIAYAGIPLVAIGIIACAFVLKEPALAFGLLVAGLLIIFFGGLDEKYKLPAYAQFIAQIAICVVVILSGWVIPYVTNPVGEGVLYLSMNSSHLLTYAPLWTLIWLLLMINAMNWLDGLDGLSSGVGLSAFVVLAAISLLPATQDNRTLSLAIIGLGIFGGFFLWNAPPAKLYLGTSGAWFLGLLIALTALLGGGKIATTLLVLAIPVIDTALVVVERLRRGQKPWIGDKKYHLHYRLTSKGWRENRTTYVLIAASLLLGILAVLGHTWLKLLLFAAAAAVLFFIIHIRQRSILKT